MLQSCQCLLMSVSTVSRWCLDWCLRIWSRPRFFFSFFLGGLGGQGRLLLKSGIRRSYRYPEHFFIINFVFKADFFFYLIPFGHMTCVETRRETNIKYKIVPMHFYVTKKPRSVELNVFVNLCCSRSFDSLKKPHLCVLTVICFLMGL